MAIAPVLASVPRYAYSVVATAILIPVAVMGQARLYGTFVLIQSASGYWCATFAGIVLTEHVVFRRSAWSRYNVALCWDSPQNLPLGVAAIVAFVCAFGVLVPFISQEWYTGPVAKAGTGDIGLLVGFLVSGIIYAALRPLECRIGQKEKGETTKKA